MRALQFTLFSLFFASYSANAAWDLNLTPGVTPGSQDIYNLHMTVLWVCVAIGIVVFGTMIYSLFYHRKSRGVKPAVFHEHPLLEFTWTLIPFLILIGLAIPGTIVLINLNDNKPADVTIKVTGYQWKWRYEYLGYGINFFSNLSTPLEERQGKKPKNPNYLKEVDNALVVPTHKKIRLLITSNDVVHSWFVSAFGVKRQAIPGFVNEIWTRIDRPGEYHGQCAELCGLNHAFMPIVVIAKNEKDFNAWLKQKNARVLPPLIPVEGAAAAPTTTTTPAPTSTVTAAPAAPAPSKAAVPTPAVPATPAAPVAGQKMTKEELIKKGDEVYHRTCAVCHQANGEGMPPLYPTLKASPIITGPLAAHIDIVLNGKPGTAMQAFRDQMSDEELAAVVTYERNSLGNNTGDVVQPEQIKTAKQ